jgi:RNA polymerase sigma factor (sigma-70 family)
VAKHEGLLSIPTSWSKVLAAGETAGFAARHQLLVRYHEAILNYLRARLPWDEKGADQLYRDFAVRVLEIDPFLRQADPERGRFRHYLAAILTRMVQDHLRSQRSEVRGQKPLTSDLRPLTSDFCLEPEAASAEIKENDPEFLQVWRQEIINQAWKSLENAQKQSGQAFYTLVRYMEENPQATAEQMAERFQAELGQTTTTANVSQIVRRGRDLFGDLLVAEVARSLQDQDGPKEESLPAERIEEELLALGLLNKYCKAALKRRKKKAPERS